MQGGVAVAEEQAWIWLVVAGHPMPAQTTEDLAVPGGHRAGHVEDQPIAHPARPPPSAGSPSRHAQSPMQSGFTTGGGTGPPRWNDATRGLLRSGGGGRRERQTEPQTDGETDPLLSHPQVARRRAGTCSGSGRNMRRRHSSPPDMPAAGTLRCAGGRRSRGNVAPHGGFSSETAGLRMAGVTLGGPCGWRWSAGRSPGLCRGPLGEACGCRGSAPWAETTGPTPPVGFRGRRCRHLGNLGRLGEDLDQPAAVAILWRGPHRLGRQAGRVCGSTPPTTIRWRAGAWRIRSGQLAWVAMSRFQVSVAPTLRMSMLMVPVPLAPA